MKADNHHYGLTRLLGFPLNDVGFRTVCLASRRVVEFLSVWNSGFYIHRSRRLQDDEAQLDRHLVHTPARPVAWATTGTPGSTMMEGGVGALAPTY